MVDVLELEDIRKTFFQGPTSLVVLNKANLKIQGGEMVGLIGPSGSGKSTLLQIAGLLENAEEGRVSILETGDSIHFDSSRSHSVWNHTDRPTTLLHVCTMDVFGDKKTVKEISSIFDCRGNLIFDEKNSIDINIHASHKS